MTHRERVLATFRFEQTDRVACDLMESAVWPELLDYFRTVRGLADKPEIWDFLDTDFRWTGYDYRGPEGWDMPVFKLALEAYGSYSDRLYQRPLANATTVAEVEANAWPVPEDWEPLDAQATRNAWPDHAHVLCPPWMPLFCGACEAFGMEEALVKMVTEPALFEAFVRTRHERYMEILRKGLASAKGICDICWLGDDYASNDALLMNPDLWRKYIKPYMAKQVQLVREHGIYPMMHSCGAIRAILPDMLDIGMAAMDVFQTRAAGMDAESIAGEFGGKLVFYGGIDCQHLLTFGSQEDVRAEVASNVAAFSNCGGYVVANSHHGISNIMGENIEAMFAAVHGLT